MTLAISHKKALRKALSKNFDALRYTVSKLLAHYACKSKSAKLTKHAEKKRRAASCLFIATLILIEIYAEMSDTYITDNEIHIYQLTNPYIR